MEKNRNFVQYSVANSLVHGDVPELNSKAQIPLGGGLVVSFIIYSMVI